MKIMTLLLLTSLSINNSPLARAQSNQNGEIRQERSQAGEESSKLDKAIHLFEAQRYQQAKYEFEAIEFKAGEKKPQFATKNFYLGRIAFIDNQLEDAASYLELALESDASQPDYHYWFGRISLHQAAKASIFSAPGYASTSKTHLLRAIELDPKHTNAMRTLISFYTNVPGIVGGSNKKAMAVSDQLITIDPVEGRIAKMAIYRDEGEEKDELLLAEKLLSENADSARGLLKAGFAYQHYEQYEKASTIFLKASRLISETSKTAAYSALYQVGRTAALSDQHIDQGIVALTEYLDLDIDQNLPGKDWAKYRLAYLYQLGDKPQNALVYAQQAIKETDDKELKKRLKKMLRGLKS